MNNIHVTNIVTIGKDDYRIIGKAFVGMLAGYKAIDTHTGKECIVRINNSLWVIIG